MAHGSRSRGKPGGSKSSRRQAKLAAKGSGKAISSSDKAAPTHFDSIDDGDKKDLSAPKPAKNFAAAAAAGSGADPAPRPAPAPAPAGQAEARSPKQDDPARTQQSLSPEPEPKPVAPAAVAPAAVTPAPVTPAPATPAPAAVAPAVPDCGPEREVAAAAGFVSSLMTAPLGAAAAERVAGQLQRLLLARFDGHWHSGNPLLGAGYRCLHSSPGRLDPVLAEALGVVSGAAQRAAAARALPGSGEFSIWIDPGEVVLRVGDRAALTTLYARAAAAAEPGRPASPATRMSASAASFAPARHAGTPPGTPEALRYGRGELHHSDDGAYRRMPSSLGMLPFREFREFTPLGGFSDIPSWGVAPAQPAAAY